MPLKKTFAFASAWALLLCVALAALLYLGPSLPRALMLIAAALLFVASVFARRHRPWAIIALIISAALTAFSSVPNVVFNFWLFATDAPLYLDSPSTIIVVAIEAMLFAIPASVLLLLFTLQWRQLKALFHAQQGA